VEFNETLAEIEHGLYNIIFDLALGGVTDVRTRLQALVEKHGFINPAPSKRALLDEPSDDEKAFIIKKKALLRVCSIDGVKSQSENLTVSVDLLDDNWYGKVDARLAEVSTKSKKAAKTLSSSRSPTPAPEVRESARTSRSTAKALAAASSTKLIEVSNGSKQVKSNVTPRKAKGKRKARSHGGRPRKKAKIDVDNEDKDEGEDKSSGEDKKAISNVLNTAMSHIFSRPDFCENEGLVGCMDYEVSRFKDIGAVGGFL
jgi:hypothetical protein